MDVGEIIHPIESLLWTVRAVRIADSKNTVLHPYINRPNNVLCCNPSMPVYLHLV